ncbi:MAG: sugar phosphate isomerase/epimerase [Armatimonadetes bacterium]|nr:sugar phosphate isomerase/epimerase [Armatimonadota bacterium]
MRIAFMTFACPEWDLAEVLGAAVELGYDGIEPRIDSQHGHGIEVELDTAGRAAVKRQAAEAGIDLCCLATSLQFNKVGDDERRRLHDDCRKRLELAADLGVPALRVFAGPVPEGHDLAGVMPLAAENLRQAGEVAAACGVELWLETHDTISKAALAGQMVDLAAHPAVNINYDVMHPYRYGEDLDETFAALGNHIRHVHFHDSKATPGAPEITRFGQGELPLLDILQRLRDGGFRGYLSGEWFNQQLGATPRESLEHYIAATRELLGQI